MHSSPWWSATSIIIDVVPTLSLHDPRDRLQNLLFVNRIAGWKITCTLLVNEGLCSLKKMVFGDFGVGG